MDGVENPSGRCTDNLEIRPCRGRLASRRTERQFVIAKALEAIQRRPMRRLGNRDVLLADRSQKFQNSFQIVAWEADKRRLGMTLLGLMMTRFLPIATAISFLNGSSALNAMLARSSPAAKETGLSYWVQRWKKRQRPCRWQAQSRRGSSGAGYCRFRKFLRK